MHVAAEHRTRQPKSGVLNRMANPVLKATARYRNLASKALWSKNDRIPSRKVPEQAQSTYGLRGASIFATWLKGLQILRTVHGDWILCVS